MENQSKWQLNGKDNYFYSSRVFRKIESRVGRGHDNSENREPLTGYFSLTFITRGCVQSVSLFGQRRTNIRSYARAGASRQATRVLPVRGEKSMGVSLLEYRSVSSNLHQMASYGVAISPRRDHFLNLWNLYRAFLNINWANFFYANSIFL